MIKEKAAKLLEYQRNYQRELRRKAKIAKDAMNPPPSEEERIAKILAADLKRKEYERQYHLKRNAEIKANKPQKTEEDRKLKILESAQRNKEYQRKYKLQQRAALIASKLNQPPKAIKPTFSYCYQCKIYLHERMFKNKYIHHIIGQRIDKLPDNDNTEPTYIKTESHGATTTFKQQAYFVPGVQNIKRQSISQSNTEDSDTQSEPDATKLQESDTDESSESDIEESSESDTEEEPQAIVNIPLFCHSATTKRPQAIEDAYVPPPCIKTQNPKYTMESLPSDKSVYFSQ